MYRNAIHTTEFWITLLAGLGAWALTWQSSLSPTYAVAATVVSVVAYTVSRSIQKNNADLKRGYRSTEFWLGVAAILGATLAAINDDIHLPVLAGAAAIISSAVTIARGIAKPSLDPADSPFDGVPTDSTPNDEGDDSAQK